MILSARIWSDRIAVSAATAWVPIVAAKTAASPVAAMNLVMMLSYSALPAARRAAWTKPAGRPEVPAGWNPAIVSLVGALFLWAGEVRDKMDDFINLFDHYGIRIELLLGSVAILVIAGAVILTVNRAVQRLLHRLRPRSPLPAETVLSIGRAVSMVLWIAVAFLLLGFWGVSVTGVWASLVSVAAVIGVGFLAVWTMISNVTASLFITIWRPFHLGDTVELLPENLKGRAIDRNFMFTVLREAENRTLLIPNNLFFQKMFRVTTASDRYLFETLEREQQRRVHETA